MSFWRPSNDPYSDAPRWAKALRDQLIRMETYMATKDQLDKLRVDVAAMIEAAADEIIAAVAAAQGASPDPAIDQLDARVNDQTKALKDAAAALRAGTPPTP